MQIRLTVIGSRGGRPRDVLVTAPDGTTLGAVTGALAATGPGPRGGRTPSHTTVHVESRLLGQDAPLGRPPLVDGAVLHLHLPAAPEAAPDPATTPPGTPTLHITGGPDAGGVHLLRPGTLRIGRSAEADVPLDDPDVSRTHALLTVAERPGGPAEVTVADPGSTNGTLLDGRLVGPDPVPLPPGALLQLGESSVVLTDSPPRPAREAVPDGEGRLRLTPPAPHPAPPLRAPGGGPEPAPSDADPSRLPATRRPPGRLGGRPFSLHRFAAAALGLLGGGPRGAAGSRRGGASPDAELLERARRLRERWPDPSELLLAALGRGTRLWERRPGHPDELCVRLGTSDLPADGDPSGADPAVLEDSAEPGTDPRAVLPAVPITVDLRETGVLGLAGPRRRLAGLARAVVAQLAGLHSPLHLELVVLTGPVDDAADGSPEDRAAREAADDWAWTRWLPHLRPSRGQRCRLLIGTTRDQLRARLAELAARMDEPAISASGGGRATVVVLDVPGGLDAALDAQIDRLTTDGPAAGIQVIALADHPSGLPPACGMWAELAGEVATHLRLRGPDGAAPERISVDGVSRPWAERFARALAPLREGAATARPERRLPDTVRLLDVLGLDQISPARIADRWAALPPVSRSLPAVLGATAAGPCTVDLVAEGPHLLAGGASGSGRTELLRAVVTSLAVADRPDRLAVALIAGRTAEEAGGPGLLSCTDLPHVSAFLDTRDPVRVQAAARALREELEARERAARAAVGAPVARAEVGARVGAGAPMAPGGLGGGGVGGSGGGDGARRPARLLVVVDDLDALLAPTPPEGRGSDAQRAVSALVRTLGAVARRGAELGVHLVAATGRPELVAGTEIGDASALRVALRADDPLDSRLLVHVEDAASGASAGAGPGRAWLRRPDGAVTEFQAGRVSGRIPRTATLRPTAVAVDWRQMGAAAERRPVREIGNGPTDLALLASALQRASEQAEADPSAPLW
ncbi:hypothetical protein BIV57_10300 [Mangrovactinospora gilvigrisea]|uniref:Cell division protein FtsK n=1 Tax=Mangrovactinospora gilvigrisea TaxID=1428644 RepID=A0A1J7BFX6_9ACTN|nr:FHA domain-containing protein [Mangrovactinospora gilvigrisea]OIV37583.1 hypothetical protein BIV57_10300 [Mangrovactinospora gilvigrisea]